MLYLSSAIILDPSHLACYCAGGAELAAHGGPVPPPPGFAFSCPPTAVEARPLPRLHITSLAPGRGHGLHVSRVRQVVEKKGEIAPDAARGGVARCHHKVPSNPAIRKRADA